jgi:acetyl-CoA carboxylase biotin carboxyl carrier protein
MSDRSVFNPESSALEADEAGRSMEPAGRSLEPAGRSMKPPGRSLFDPAVLRDLFQQLASTDIDELEIVAGEARLFLRREPGRRRWMQAPPAGAAEREADVSALVPVSAPLTGIFYARSSPEGPAFVEPGAMVEPGEVVALIETMKLFNEVTVDVAGEVLSVVAQDGDLVETDQALMYIRPQAEGETFEGQGSSSGVPVSSSGVPVSNSEGPV